MAYSDTAVNKSMKKLVKSFYNILLNCENYSVKSSSAKITFLNKYVDHNKSIKNSNNTRLVDYFDKYQAFCLDLFIFSLPT